MSEGGTVDLGPFGDPSGVIIPFGNRLIDVYPSPWVTADFIKRTEPVDLLEETY